VKTYKVFNYESSSWGHIEREIDAIIMNERKIHSIFQVKSSVYKNNNRANLKKAKKRLQKAMKHLEDKWYDIDTTDKILVKIIDKSQSNPRISYIEKIDIDDLRKFYHITSAYDKSNPSDGFDWTMVLDYWILFQRARDNWYRKDEYSQYL